MEVLGRYLDAMGPFLKYFPDAVGSVINKLFELLNSLPFVVKVLFLFVSLFCPITCNEDQELCLFYPTICLAGSFNKQCTTCKVADLYIIYSNGQSC